MQTQVHHDLGLSRPRLAARLVIAFIHFYQRASPPAVRGRCRFIPTCSEYAALAIERYGLLAGGGRALARLIRCRPPNCGRDDP